MIRVTQFTILGVLVLALGLGPIGCGGETTGSKPSPADRTKKEEAMKKLMEEKKKGAAGAPGEKDEKNKEDQSKSGDNDK